MDNPDSGVADDGSAFSIRQVASAARQKHGIRHENHLRYRLYCTRRIRRIRVALKSTNRHKCVRRKVAEFTRVDVTSELPAKDKRYFELVLMDAERNWAHAMQLKQEVGDDKASRKKHHARRKLRRSIKWAAKLKRLCAESEAADAELKTEAGAYHQFLRAALCFEEGNDERGLELYKQSKEVCDFSTLGSDN